MSRIYELLLELTEPGTPVNQLHLREFSRLLGWQPTDNFTVPNLSVTAKAHLMVEHGLENAAVISFLGRRSYNDLSSEETRALLGVSYNNLVDWHVGVNQNEVVYIYNRMESPKVVHRSEIARSNTDALTNEAFERIVGRRPNPNVPALDSALIDTISIWKRELSTALNYQVDNNELSALFNKVIFVRAAEDHAKNNRQVQIETLRSIWYQSDKTDLPNYIAKPSVLEKFKGVDSVLLSSMIEDFYENRYARFYSYDFSVMSKHALSRIYEHYVSLLSVEQSSQDTLFPKLPNEERNKAFGSFYTPQYISRFFARYIARSNSTERL